MTSIYIVVFVDETLFMVMTETSVKEFRNMESNLLS